MSIYKCLIVLSFFSVACGGSVPIDSEAATVSASAIVSCPSYDECSSQETSCSEKSRVINPYRGVNPYVCLPDYYECMSKASDCDGWQFLGCLYSCDEQ